MKKKKRHSALIHRLICLLMALHVINLSIDPPDQYGTTSRPYEQAEDLSVNDIESFGELLLEECFGLVDAVPEHDEPDEESSLTKLGQDYVFVKSFVFAPLVLVARFLVAEFIPFSVMRVPTHVLDILSPPPQVTL